MSPGWPRGVALLALGVLLLPVCVPRPGRAQPGADQLRQEARVSRADAAKKRALAKEYRSQAESLRRRAAEARANAAAARKSGKTDRAVSLEQQARSDDNEADRRLEVASRFDRDAELLEKTARDREEAADRLARDEPAPDTPAGTYQRARVSLEKAADELAALRDRGAMQWVGRELDRGVHRYAVFSQADLTELFAGPIQQVQKLREELDTAWGRFSAKKATADELAAECYRAVYYGQSAAFTTQLNSGATDVQFLAAEQGRAQERLDQALERSRQAVQDAYQAGSLTVAERDARRAALQEQYSQDMHGVFDRLAPR
ncbi:MAG TPA: hypothetical protein VFU47_06940, partial [Armatimonadota bacterium]|nr:hypothetical protein [Armatimonadota bacterium]